MQPETDGKAVDVIFQEKDADLFGRTKSRRGFSDELQYLLQIENRPADDLEHIARCRLVFERCFEFAGALAQFIEQPRILDGDDGLRGKVLNYCNLFVSKRTHFLAKNGNASDQIVFFEHRNSKQSASASKVRESAHASALAPPRRRQYRTTCFVAAIRPADVPGWDAGSVRAL